MARTAREVPNLFPYRGRWCFKIGEKRRVLCPLTPEQAQIAGGGRKPTPTREQYEALLSALVEAQPTRRNASMRVDDLCNLYLKNRDGKISPVKHAYYVRTLQLFCGFYGANAIGEITPDMVQTFVASQPTWRSLSTQRAAYKVILQAFNYAEINRYVPSSPLKALGKMIATEAPEQRREVYITPEQEAALMVRLNPASLAIFKALLATGRRPDELCNVRKAEVVETPHGLVWRVEKHKNRKRTGKAETIDHLTPAMQQLSRELLVDPRNETPYLFATIQGRKWTGFNVIAALGHAADRVRQDHPGLGLDDVTPYAFRHTFITRALLAGVPLAVVAKWVGNSPVVLAKHYNQLERVASTATAAHVALLCST